MIKNLRGLVSIPNYVSFKSGLEFANENVKWLYKEINKILPIVLIKHNTSLLIMGKRMKIIFEEDNFNKVYIKNNKIIIVSQKMVIKNFKKWIVRQILNQSKNYVDIISKSLDLNIKAIKISNSFNYWGSCNSAGIIHLNWRLIFAPTKILKYIIVHELCHLKEFNHTKNFGC